MGPSSSDSAVRRVTAKMKKMTEKSLLEAFAGESQAAMKYQIFADQAEKEFPNVARMFRAISFAERVHATNHLKALGGVKGTADNLDAARGGESFEIHEMYPAYLAIAQLQVEAGAQRSMDWALEAEKVHEVMYGQAKESVLSGQDIKLDTVHICDLCGWTVEGEAPDICPVCKAKQHHFKAF